MDPYRILNLSSDASLKEIKKAFHTLSLRCHPDKAGESSTLLFQHVNAAFQMLKPGDFDQQKKSSAAYMRQQTDFDNYTTAELYEDILRDFEKARAAYERAEQRRSSSEQWGGDSDNEYSGDEYRIPHEEKKGEDCPVCKECPCRLFNTEEKPAVNHNESPTCDKNKPPPKRDAEDQTPSALVGPPSWSSSEVSDNLAFTARIDEDEVFKDLSNFFIVRGEQEPADSHRAQSSTPSKYRSPVAHVLDEIPQDQSYLFTAKEPQQPEVPQEAKEERINEEQKSWVCMITDVGRLVGDCVSIRREMHESLKELERKLDDLNRETAAPSERICNLFAHMQAPAGTGRGRWRLRHDAPQEGGGDQPVDDRGVRRSSRSLTSPRSAMNLEEIEAKSLPIEKCSRATEEASED